METSNFRIFLDYFLLHLHETTLTTTKHHLTSFTYPTHILNLNTCNIHCLHWQNINPPICKCIAPTYFSLNQPPANPHHLLDLVYLHHGYCLYVQPPNRPLPNPLYVHLIVLTRTTASSCLMV